MDVTERLPLDWNEWETMWRDWLTTNGEHLHETRRRFPGQNFLAVDYLGTWRVGSEIVEMAAVIFPNLSERDENGRLLDTHHRFIGLTFEWRDPCVVASFAELEQQIGLRP